MKSESTTKRQVMRNPYFDFLRGIAILMVVGIHTYPGNHNLTGPVSEVVQLVLINIFNCAVPLFLAISGYFLAKKKLTTWIDCREFWKKQIPVVYIPCLIFSLPWFITSCISMSWGGIFANTLNFFLCGYSVYYFIALIIECYLLAPVLVRHNNVTTLILTIIISLSATLMAEYTRFYLGVELPLLLRGSCPVLLIFFYIGIFLSRRSRNYSLWIPISLMVTGIILGLLQMQYIRETFAISAQGQKITLYLFDAGVILFCMSQKCESAYRANPINRLILYIGEISFGIYFTHVYLIYIADRFFPAMRENWIILWLFSLILTMLIIMAVKKIAPVYAKKYLGYR